MGCNNKNSANITTTLAAGSIDSPYFVQVHIAQTLCSPVCVDDVPIFAPTFSVVGYEAVGTGQYVATIKVEGIVYYDPCGGNTCNSRSITIKQTFPVAFTSATAPTSVTISAGTIDNSLVAPACHNCTRDFVSDIPITITVA